MANRVMTKACDPPHGQEQAHRAEVVPVLRPQPAAELLPGPEVVEAVVAVADRGISKHGEPSSPTLARTGPSSGTMALVAIMQFSPVRPPAG